jgi:hypothetical protein
MYHDYVELLTVQSTRVRGLGEGKEVILERKDRMKLFLSWSGDRSKLLAEYLYEWIPNIINAVDPWYSPEDIAPGKRWSSEIAIQLETTSFGVICLTEENLNAPWILFEAGALSKSVNGAYVVPLLLDNKPSEIKGPLAEFNALQVKKGHIKKLLETVNTAVAAANEKSIKEASLAGVFEKWWPDLEEKVASIPKTIEPKRGAYRSDRDMIDEILVTVRGLRQEVGRSVISADAERILGVLFSRRNVQRKEFAEYLSSLSDEEKEIITSGMVNVMSRGSILDNWFGIYHPFGSINPPLKLSKAYKEFLYQSKKFEDDNNDVSKDGLPEK